MAEGVGVELGVAGGAFSDVLLTVGKLSRLYSVDRWSDHHDEAEMERAKLLLAKHGARSCVIRCTFAEATECFGPSSLDFIYLDGYAHTGQDGGKTLEDWYPKLRSGGIFAGHDYSQRFPLTIKAVDEFAARVGAIVNVTDGNPSGGAFDSDPSWWWRKS